MGWAYWANLLNIKLSPNILLGARPGIGLKNGHVHKAISSNTLNLSLSLSLNYTF
jgi:hypothetical protein